MSDLWCPRGLSDQLLIVVGRSGWDSDTMFCKLWSILNSIVHGTPVILWASTNNMFAQKVNVCLVTGAKVRDEIYEAFDNIYPILKSFKKQWDNVVWVVPKRLVNNTFWLNLSVYSYFYKISRRDWRNILTLVQNIRFKF